MSTLLRSRRWLSWLSVNILLNIAAASVIALYQETLALVFAIWSPLTLPLWNALPACAFAELEVIESPPIPCPSRVSEAKSSYSNAGHGRSRHEGRSFGKSLIVQGTKGIEGSGLIWAVPADVA